MLISHEMRELIDMSILVHSKTPSTSVKYSYYEIMITKRYMNSLYMQVLGIYSCLVEGSNCVTDSDAEYVKAMENPCNVFYRLLNDIEKYIRFQDDIKKMSNAKQIKI
jgi:hypothetical protein